MVSNKRTVCAGLLLLATLFLLVSVTDDSEAETYTVDNLGGSDYTNITQAVDNASAGDTIRVASRTYYDAVDVDKRLTLIGGNYGVELGDLYDCYLGDLVTSYRLNENGGDTAYDDVWCDDFNGDIEGASWTTGVWDGGLDFDGSDDYVEIDHDSAFNFSSTMSISAWINWDDVDDRQIIVSTFTNVESGSDRGGFMFRTTTDSKIRFSYAYSSSDSDYCESESELDNDKWYLATAVFTGSSIQIYLNDELDNTCSITQSIAGSSNDLSIGASDYDENGNYEDFFDGTIDDLAIWSDALTSTEVENIFWGGNGVRPVVNASNGGYSFKISADSTQLKNFGVEYSGSDGADSAQYGDAGVRIYDADSVKLYDIDSKYNKHGIRIWSSDDVRVESIEINGCDDGSEHKRGLHVASSNGLVIRQGGYNCATGAGIFLPATNGPAIIEYVNLNSNKVGIKVASNGNYINYTNFNNNYEVGLLFLGGDNNQVKANPAYDSFWENKYGISFSRGANGNTINGAGFYDSDDYDIHHGYNSNSSVNGWDNILIDTEFDEFYIDSNSRMLEKTLVETTIKDNGTYYWNRVNTTLDSDRKAYSGTNSFWAGDADDDEYGDNWDDVTFKMKSDVSLPSGDISESRILEIKTWYKTEPKFDGGRVYISKNSGTTWNLLTPLGGYDELMNDGSDCDNDEKAFTGDKSSLGWHTKQFNLSDYRGEDVRIKFVFCSDSSNVWDGWYIDDVKIYKDADPTVVAYFDNFERLGHMWVDPRDWTHEGSPEYRGKRNVDVKIIDGTSSEVLHNSTNLVAHWKFDETSGSYTYETLTSTYGYLSNGASFTTGRFGNAVKYDGVNDNVYSYLNLPTSRLYETTISAWVKFGDFPSDDYGTIVNPGYDGRFWLQVDNSTGTPVASFGGYGNYGVMRATGTTTLVSGVWYNLVGTFSESGDFFKVYVNGTLEDTTTTNSAFYIYTGNQWTFGKNYYNNQGSCSGYCYLNGTIDNVQVWDTAYGSAQISSLYSDPLTGPVLYSTQHYGGSDDKTNSDGKLDDIHVITKVYDGSSSGASVTPYIGLRYGDWTRPVKATTISDNKLEANILDFRVYNRNKEKLYYSLGSATDAASSGNVIEVWPGKYKENVVINTKLTIIGSGRTRTIIDGQYLDSSIKIDSNGDYTKIKNLQVTRSFNSTTSCSSSNSFAGIFVYYASDVTIDNVFFFESYNGLMTYGLNNLKVTNSLFDRGSSSGYYGAHICNNYYTNQDSLLFENNIITKYSMGLYLQNLYQGIDIYNNYIHNNTSYGIYINQVSHSSYASGNPLVISGNRIVDNYYGVYKYDSSSSWGRYAEFEDNLVKSNTYYGVYCNQWCQDWKVENNTFDGDNDQDYGWYSSSYQYRTEFGNNTFREHTNKDIYLRSCGTGTSANKFFYNTYSSITVSSSCQVDIYNNLNVKTVEEDSDPFSNVELEIKDSSKTYYETPHWGGSDSLTDSSGFISDTIFMRSGYYASSSTLTDNNITVNYAYGIRAQSTWTTFDEDTTKSFTIPNEFRLGVVKNTNTSVLYTSFSSAISAASAGNVLDVWAWTYNENVVITKGVTLIGNSTVSAIINGGTGSYAVEVKSHGVIIKNLTLSGSSVSLLYAENYDNLHVENVMLSSIDSNYGIYFDRTEQTTIISVTVNSTAKKSVYVTDGKAITFKDSYFMNSSSSHGFHIVDSEDIILDNVLIYNSGYNGSTAYGLYITGSDDITIKNSVKVASSKSYELFVNDVSDLIIRNSTFVGNNLASITSSNGFLVENSMFKGTLNGDYGVGVKSTVGAIFKDNTIKNSAADGGSDYGALYLTGSSSSLIQNNTILNSGKSGIHLKSSSANNKIYGNTVTSSYYNGLYVQSSHGNLIRNNTFSSSGDHGIKIASSVSIVVDNNTLDSNTDNGLYVSSADDITIKSNTVSDNNAGIYISTSDDPILSSNTIESQTTFGVYIIESERVKFKSNIVKNNNNDALTLSSGCDDSFIDNNTIKDNGQSSVGKAIKLFEVDGTIIYNNSILSNDYTGITIALSNSNFIVHNTIKSNGKYGISITSDLTTSANNTIKDNTINDNQDIAIYIDGIFTKIINNTIKYNDKDGIQILANGARTTIQQNNFVDNEENAIHVIGNNVLVTSNTIDGDTSEMAILVINSRAPSITNNTIMGGEQGIKIQNTTNAFVYNNTVNDNSGYGIYLLMGSHSGQVKYNTVKSNEDDGIYLHSSNLAEVLGNTIQDNNGYGILASSSKLVEFKSNTLTGNDGGVKYVDCDYCNLTSMTIIDNGGRGIWFTSGSDNNYIKHTNSSDSSLKDVFFTDSNDNMAFNFTFSTISVGSNSSLTLTSNLEIVFHDGSDDGFQGIDFALLTDGVKVYSTPFYGGTDAVSNSDGEAESTFSLNYRVYDGSSTPDITSNIIKYHYGVRSKEKSIDMSTSHTETITVPSHWVKGLVKDVGSGDTWYNIQDAIDNASSGDTLHIWAWTYYENVDVDESITIIGNGTGNTTINASASGRGFNISSDDVTIRNLEVVNCGNEDKHNGIQADGDDALIENVKVSKCYKGIAIGGSGVWVGNSTITNNYYYGINVFEGETSTTLVKIYNNTISFTQGVGIYNYDEDDTIIKNNIVRNNSNAGISLGHSDDVTISYNTVYGNSNNILIGTSSSGVVISFNTVTDGTNSGIYVNSGYSDNGIIEGNTIKDNGANGISIKDSDYFYLGNNTISGSDNYDLKFDRTTIGHSAKNTTFSTISVHNNAYFAIYNDLTLKFMQNDTAGFDGLDVKLVSDGTTKYATSYYSGSDSKTDVNGSISSDFTLKFRIYDGSSTPDEATTTLYYHHGVRAKAYNLNMTTSHTETVTVPSYWKKGLVENLDTGLKSSTIQDAIDNASQGDRLQLWDWDYVEYGIDVDQRVTIFGNSSSVTVSGNWQDVIFSLETNDITLKNLTIEKSGNSTDDACIDIGVGSGIKVDNVILKNCNVGILVETSGVVISNVTIQDSAKDGIIVKASGVTIENSTIKSNGRNGIELHANTLVYNNTITDNQKDGINVTANSDYARIISNIIEDNDDQAIYVYGSHHVEIKNNVLEDNDYGILLHHANFTQIHNNEVKEHDVGGIKFVSTNYCNLTSSTIKDNSGRGIWFRANSDSNNLRDTVSSGSTNNDIELDSSKRNTGFNFTFGSGKIGVDQNSDFRVMYSLNIKFVNGSSAFAGVDLELFNYDMVLYASPFYGGNDGVSDSDGFIDEELTVAYEIYNGSSTTEDVDTTLKYHYGVRGKSVEVDMSTSHTETVDVPSFWTKGLVRNVDTSTDYYKIQHAIDNASAGDTLNVWAWTYYETLDVDRRVNIVGNGTDNTTIDGQSNNDYVVDIKTDDVTIKSLKIINGNSHSIYTLYDDINLENIVVHNSGDWGIYADSTERLTVSNSVVSSSANGGIYTYNSATIKDSNIVDNNYYGIKVQGTHNNVENSTVSGTTCSGSCSSDGDGIYVWGDLAFIYNNTISNNSYSGIYADGSSSSKYINNKVVDNNGAGIELYYNWGGNSASVINNQILRNEKSGLYLSNVDLHKIENNTIKNNDESGIVFSGSVQNYMWNNTISLNEDLDIKLESFSDGNYAINTVFTTISVDSNSDLTLKEYFVLDVNDASGNNMSGIDIKVMEDDTLKYASSYFGGSDPKTDSYGTIETFLIDYVIYDGSSTSTTIPTYVTARSNDWVETFTSDPSSTIQITVPDLRVLNIRSEVLTYHIQTALDAANSGDTIHAWAGIYYENLEITEEITLKGNGTSTVINGTYTNNGIEVKEDNVIIKNLTVVSSSTGGDEAGIAVYDSEDVQILDVKFIDNTNGLYLEDAPDLTVVNSIFDVNDYGVYTIGSSSGLIIQDSEFRNGSSSNACIYQSSSDENGGAQITATIFDNCYTGWKSGSSNNIFRDNTLRDNDYGIMLTGTESYNNMIIDNTIDDSYYGIYIYNSAHDNDLFNNVFDDSEEYDIRLSDSDDTVSYNNTFSDIYVSEDANMWIKVYIDLTVYDNSSNAFQNADVRVKQDNLALYSTSYFGGSDSKTNSTGQIETFLVATLQYNGSSTPDAVTTSVSTRYSDWIETSTYNVNNVISISVDDFRVQNEDTEEMFYSISGAIDEANLGDTLLIWAGTYRELVTIDKELTLVGNGTSRTIINGSFQGDVVTVTADEVSIEHITISGSGTDNSGLVVSEGVGTFTKLKFTYNDIGYSSSGDFNVVSDSNFISNAIGLLIDGDDNVVLNNYFSENPIGIQVNNNSEDTRLDDNEITKSSNLGIYLYGAEESIVKNNHIHNNSGNGVYLESSHENVIYLNTLEYNSADVMVLAAQSGNSSIHNNTFKSNDDSPVKVDSSYYNTFKDNVFTANDDYFTLEGGGYNHLISNTFDETGIQLYNSNNQFLTGNTITDAPKNGIRIFKSSSDNYLADNSISDSDDEDLYVGGSGGQRNNRGYSNAFDDIKVLSNGEFIVLDYIWIRTVNFTGNMSGNDVKATYLSEMLYSSEYFGGDDPVTDSDGRIPDFLAPVDRYNGSSTPAKVVTPITVRHVDWMATFDLDPYQGSSITAFVPDLRVKNNNTGEWSYHIQTSIDNAGTDDLIIVTPGTYYENVVVNKARLTLEAQNYEVIIDAQDSGCAITIIKTSKMVTLRGFNITNSFEWEDPVNSSGIKVLSDSNIIENNRVTESFVGIFLETADLNVVQNNYIDEVDVGIMLSRSDSNYIYSNTIKSADQNDIEIGNIGNNYGSKSNTIESNNYVGRVYFEESSSNILVNQTVDTIELVDSVRNSAISSEYQYVICDADSSFYLKNFLDINISRLDAPLADVDLKVWDGNTTVYSTSYFGGADSMTTEQGKTPDSILVIYRVYNGSSVGSDNVTQMKVRVGDWFKSEQSLLDEYKQFDFDVPVFRIINQNTGVEYSYIQRAIDNATAGDTIFLSSGEYNENVVIDKLITLVGTDPDSTIIAVIGGGSGSPPLYDSSLPGINVTADYAEIVDIQVRDFDTGIRVDGAAGVRLFDVKVLDSKGVGIDVVQSENVLIERVYVSGSSEDNIRADNSSHQITIRDTISVDSSRAGIAIASDGAFVDNATLSSNDLYGCHLSGADATISGSQIHDNGINAIYLNGVLSATIDHNTIFDNGGTEIVLTSSYDVDIYQNNISDSEHGFAIKTPGSDYVEIFDNVLGLSISLASSFSEISNNDFSNIDPEMSIGYDNTAIIVSGDYNTISDNTMYNVDIAFVFLEGDYNLVENNTLTLIGSDIEYYTSGMNNTFINTELNTVNIDPDSYFQVFNYVDIEMSTVNGPATGVELDVHYVGGSSIYLTSNYGGSDSTTDFSGTIDRLFLIYHIFDGDFVPMTIETRITYYYDGAEYNITLDTSISHPEKIWVNLRPVASIDQINGVGDIQMTGTEEAIKGADVVMTDSHTIAYWSFNEGSGSTVTDATAAYTGTINPTAMWNEGRPNATDDYSVEFDGTFTNIGTNLEFESTEFTAEVWFKTDCNECINQVLFSDKAGAQYAYNLYINKDSGVLAFDFKLDTQELVSLTSTGPQTIVTDNEWHFAVVVRGEDYVELWLDGVKVAEREWSGDIDFASGSISIGQNPLGSESFKGLIDDLRFSDIARHNEDFMMGSGVVEFVSDSYDLDGEITEYIWTSEIDGEIGRGQILYLPVDSLTPGSHNIQLQVIDDNGTVSDYASSVLVVMERPDSEIVSVKVNGDSVWSGWGSIEANSGDNVSFEGRTAGSQFISEFSWTSDQDGVISTVAEFDIDTLSNGTHAIIFKLKGANGLWSAEQEVRIYINGRPVIGNSNVTSETLDRLKSAMFKVRIEDDNTAGSSLVYDVGYRIKGGGGEWESEYISDTSYNSGTGDLEFTFTPDQNAPTGEYEFFVEATDEEDGVSDYYVMSQSITVQNNDPEIQQSNLDSEDGEFLEFTEGTTIELGVDATDADGVVSTVIWYADPDGDGSFEEIGTGANFTYENNNLPPGENTIKSRVLDNEGGYAELSYTIVIKEAPIEVTLIDTLVEDFSSNLPLIALLGAGMVMVVGTILLRRRKVTEVVAEGLEVDDGVSEQPRDTFDTLEWDIPTDAQGNALIIGEYMAKRRESYLTYPNNDEVLDYLHNNRERFQISSYFDVPAEPPVVLTDWALPDNLRGNVHLDSQRKQIVERISNSSPDKNFVIIGEPGVGKTVMMFEVFDRLMYQAPVGILTTDMIAKAHEMFGVRVFYDDIPENQKLVEALTDNEIKGVIVTSREADWKALPTEMQAKFDRLTVPLFNELDMKEMIKKMMTFQSIGFNEKAIVMLAEYSEGSPIYVWSMVREMMHRSVKSLSEEYIKENSIKGMINYVGQLLQRLLKDGEEYRSGGLHALASLIFLSDHMEERYCNDYFFDAYVEVLSKHTEEKLDDKMNPKTLNLVLAYLPINDSVIRFPHDTWPDVLQGWGDMNPFSSELRMINRLFADSGLFQSLKKEVVSDVWNSTYERYKRTPSRQKISLLALADTLFQNFTIDELKKLGVDIDIVRQVASTYSHIPQAAKLLSKIQSVLPQTVTRIINVQDIGSEKGHAPYKIQEMYLIYNDGRMITSLMDEEAKVDSDIMSSMLTAINDFVKDSFQTSGNLGSIDYGENQVILERGKYTILASVVYGEANRDLRSRMGRALTKMEDEFGSILKNWDGDIDSLSGSLKHLEPVMDLSKSVTKNMISELQALKEVGLRSSWSQIAGFVQVNLMINNYSKKQLKGAKFSLEYGADYLKLIKTEPSLKHSVTEVELKPIKANDEVGVTLYFEPLKSTQASLNVHLDYEAKGGQSSGVSTAVFERVDLYKEGTSLDVSSLDNASKAEIVTTAVPVEVVESTMGEVEIVEVEVEEVTDAPIEEIEMAAEVVEVAEVEAEVVEVAEVEAEVVEVAEVEDVEIVDEPIEEIVMASEVEEAEVIEAVPEAEVIEEPAEPAPDPGESGVDDILSKLSELDDPENAPKKKEKKSDEEEDKSGMNDVLGKLDEL